MNGAIITDGTKAVPLSALRPEAWHTWAGEGDEGERLSALRGSRLVPWLYRAILVRANSVASVPFALYRNEEDISADEASKPLMHQIRKMLRQTERMLCLYGANYYELGSNRAGRNLTPFWLLPPTVQPDVDPTQGLRGFRRLGPSGLATLAPDKIIYIWLEADAVEVGPGTPPAQVVLAAAGLLHHLDVFASGFFERGAIKMTLLTVEGNPGKGEVEKLDAWWKRMVQGVKSAFGSVVIRAGVKPVIIGSDIKDTAAPALTKLAREDVATGMGVPQSLLMSSALAGGTADAERLNFYDLTIVPECLLIEEAFNGQWLARLGLRMAFQPERLEVYQKAELQKAQALSALTGGQVLLTVDEAREQLGRKPMAEVTPAPAATSPLPSDGTDASATTPTTEPVADQAAVEDSLLLPGTLDALSTRALDLDRWQRKALKRLRGGRAAACTFESDEIDADEADAIRHALLHAATPDAVKAAFEPGGDLSDAERALYERLRKVLVQVEVGAADAILDGRTPDPAVLAVGIRAALLASLSEAVNVKIAALAAEYGIDLDLTTIGADIAGDYVTRYLQGIDATTRSGLERAITAYRATPGMTREDLLALLRGTFGARRAELIAITSLTEASNQATAHYQAMLQEHGVEMERVWRTANDERVCPICGPLNGRPEPEWKGRFPNGGPAHPRCRCGTTLRIKRQGD